MKKILFIVFPLIVFNASGQNTKTLDSLVNLKTESIKTKMAALEKTIEIERNINDKTFNSISTQISAASLTFSIMGVAFAIVAIAVGVYVTYIERKIIKIGAENKELLSKNERIKNDVEGLNKTIQGDIQGLFNKLKRQETMDLLNRLLNVPKDISNICTVLLSRELHDDDFEKLKQAYNKLNAKDDSYKANYKLLFFQHFLTNTLKDEELRKELLDFIPNGIELAFENDILKSAHDFIVAVVDKGLNNFKAEANSFFIGLSSSQHKDYEAVYQTLFDSLKSRQNRFDFINLIYSTDEARIAKIAFGKLLIKEYAQGQVTETEALAIKSIKDLEVQHLQSLERTKGLSQEVRQKGSS